MERPGDDARMPITLDTLIHAASCDSARPDATMHEHPAGVAQLVERQPSKLNVAGSNPVTRFGPRPPEGGGIASTQDG